MKMNPWINLIAAFVTTLLAACSVDKADSETVELEPYLVPCFSWYPSTCMVGREVGSDTTRVSYYLGEIQGFEFSWGFRQRLAVESYPVKNPPADGSSIRYVASGPVTRIPAADWSFKASLYDSRDWKLAGDSLIIEGYPRIIRIADPADRLLLQASKPEEQFEIVVEPGSGDWLSGHSVVLTLRP
jgi:Domain of unknown function (DUF4377)